jgi:hypothetical protein
MVQFKQLWKNLYDTMVVFWFVRTDWNVHNVVVWGNSAFSLGMSSTERPLLAAFGHPG